MAYEHKDGNGTLNVNEYKTLDKHPDIRGSITAHRNLKAGEKVSLGVWNRVGPRGSFFSIQMTDFVETKKTDSAGYQNKRSYEDLEKPETIPEELDDKIPF